MTERADTGAVAYVATTDQDALSVDFSNTNGACTSASVLPSSRPRATAVPAPPSPASLLALVAMPSVMLALSLFCLMDEAISCNEALVSSTLAACWLAVIKAGPCVVVQAKSVTTDGYEAVQLGLVEEKPAKATKSKTR